MRLHLFILQLMLRLGYLCGRAAQQAGIGVAFLLLAGNLCGQQGNIPSFIVKDFTPAAGLCNGNIRLLSKDKQGYLWIGTTNGLSRFDGKFFTNFYHAPEDAFSIGHNFIHGIICAADGSIWILQGNGLSLFDPMTHSFMNYPIKEFYPHFSGTYHMLAEGHDGHLWIGNQNGLALFSSTQKRFRSPQEVNRILGRQDDGFAGNGIQGMAKGEKGDIWFCTYTTLFKWEPDKAQTITIGTPPFKGIKNTLAITGIDTVKGIVYTGTYEAGLLAYNYRTQQWQQFRTGADALSTPTYDPVKMHQPYNNALYAYISDLGYGFFDPITGALLPQQPVPYSKDRVMQTLLADEGHLWIGTDNGLLLLSPERIALKNLTTAGQSQGAFNTVQMHPAAPLLFAGNYGTQTSFEMPVEGGHRRALKGINGLLRYHFYSRNGTEWISTENEVFHKKKDGSLWEKVPVMHPGMASEQLLTRNFAEDDKGRLWLRVRNAGAFLLDSNAQVFRPVAMPRQAVSPVYADLLFCPLTKTLWISEENTGLYALTEIEKSWRHHPLKQGNTPLTAVRIVLGSKGTIVFADPFNGIGMYQPQSQTLKLISQKNGLLSNNVSSIDTDESGNLWTFSPEGLSKIMAGTEDIANFSHPMLRKVQEIACGKNGMVYIATAEGLFSLAGKDLVPHFFSGKIRLDKVEVLGKAIPLNGSFSLPASGGDIRITFSYTALYAQQRPGFEYRFEGEQDWKSTGEQNNISFSRLSSGNYHLFIRMKEQADQNTWLQVRWTIEKPFWQKLWFIVLLTLLGAGTAYVLVQKRISAIREKSALRQKMAETEMAALQAQMNPHFLFNALNSIDAMVQEGDRYNATTYLNKFARLIRNVLDGSRQKSVPLSQDIESLRLYLELESMRLDNSFDWEITGAAALMQMDIKIPSLMVQPYVENAILHGVRHLTQRKGNITIDYRLEKGALIATITDNGNGREYAHTMEKTKQHSHGMTISKSRIENFNFLNKGTVTIEDLRDTHGNACGTRVIVYLPIM